MLMALTLIACSDKPSPETDDGENTGTQTAEATTPSVSSQKITLDDVTNAPVLSEDDLLCAGGGELIECTTDETVFALPETYKGEKITEIHSYMFGNNTPVAGIRLPDSLQLIQAFTFGANENLRVVYCGNGLRTIEHGAFMACNNLHTVILCDGIERIEEMVFAGDTSLRSIGIPSSVIEIGGSAFFEHADDFTIIGTPGSYAEQYAADHGIPFQANTQG